MSLLTRTGADGVLPGWHTIIRGLAPQAGGFRRRSNRGASVIVADRAHCSHRASPMRAASGYRPPAVSYHTPVRVRLSTPNNDPVARNAQYITNRGANPPRCRCIIGGALEMPSNSCLYYLAPSTSLLRPLSSSAMLHFLQSMCEGTDGCKSSLRQKLCMLRSA